MKAPSAPVAFIAAAIAAAIRVSEVAAAIAAASIRV